MAKIIIPVEIEVDSPGQEAEVREYAKKIELLAPGFKGLHDALKNPLYKGFVKSFARIK